MTRQIALTQDRTATIDDEDFERVSQLKWCANLHGRCWYAETRTSDGLVYLHRFILGAKHGEFVDHANGDTLDCCRANLRICTKAQNNRNQSLASHNTSGYKGVSWQKRARKWQVGIKVDGKRIHVGFFHSREDAARAYNRAAIQYHGEFARLNLL